MFSYTMLCNEHASIRCGFESADMSVVVTSYGRQNWTLGKENRGDDIC